MECSLTLDGRGLTIVPVRLGQLPAFVRAIEPFAKQLASGQFDPVDLIADHGVMVIRALEVATGQPREWIESLALDDAVQLAATVLEVNADFFVRRVLPSINDATQKLASIYTSNSATGS